MASHQLIDTQFDRAVQMVQSIPKTGPIQTDYEDKLTMYSLFKQATVGNVKGPRPGIWDVIGRAKWDAWEKHKDLDPHEAKQMYVEVLLKIFRKYSDKTVARNLVEELVSLGGPDQSSVHRSRSPSSDSSGSTTSERAEESGIILSNQMAPNRDDELTTEEEFEEDSHEFPPVNMTRTPLENRPPSSLSSQRYRTPLGGSLIMSPPLRYHIPAQQPLPGFETPSAFAEAKAIRSSNAPAASIPRSSQYDNDDSEQTLEHSVERLQIQLAAVTERLGTLESRSVLLSRSNLGPPMPPAGTSSWLSGQGARAGAFDALQWDIDDLGMWSLVLNPLSRGIVHLREVAIFFARNEHRSPSMTIVRRLCLDVSFLISVIMTLRSLWIRSGVRRREVKFALILLWRAIVGSNAPRNSDYL